ncbi:hypothetical protein SAMN05444411_1171 [Lutibacter oricola]|uniref:Uncharacterized protein n=1 Tax=Lutibacter oricola TaxID=762486 RepID=A0A1H3GTJ4_9FLAO|nr:hypothetical protein [Lutibacter oricola]SDY05968.1 hypothetical protein SAMN05444411_1171 [Lutibacter oricola]
MEKDIIDTNYIYHHKYYYLWKIPYLVYGGLLIYLTTNDSGINRLIENDKVFQSISGLFLFFIFVIPLLNTFLFSRIGKFKITDNEMFVQTDKIDKTIQLKEITNIEYIRSDNKFYDFKFDSLELTIEMTKTELREFESICKELGVHIEKKGFLKRFLFKR